MDEVAAEVPEASGAVEAQPESAATAANATNASRALKATCGAAANLARAEWRAGRRCEVALMMFSG